MPGSGGQDPRFIRRANPFVVTDPADGAGDIDADAAQLLSQILDVVLGESEKRGTIPEVSGLVRTEGGAAESARRGQRVRSKLRTAFTIRSLQRAPHGWSKRLHGCRPHPCPLPGPGGGLLSPDNFPAGCRISSPASGWSRPAMSRICFCETRRPRSTNAPSAGASSARSLSSAKPIATLG